MDYNQSINKFGIRTENKHQIDLDLEKRTKFKIIETDRREGMFTRALQKSIGRVYLN